MKSVFKITPVSLYDIQGLERWLEERAGDGLFPVWINSDLTRFHRNEAVPGARFRLEAANGQEAPEPERLELYKEAGWEYAGAVGKLYFLFHTANPSAPELHTDPVTRGISLEWLAGHVQRARRKMRVWRLLILGILVFGALLIWRTDTRLLPLYLLDMSGTALILLIFFLWGWRVEERDCRLLLEFQSSLELGLTPKPGHPGRWHWLMTPLAVLLLALLVGDRLYQRALPLEGFSKSYVNLQQLESEPLTTYQTLFPDEHQREWNRNTVSQQFSLLSPDYYRVEQNLFSFQAGARPGGSSPSGDPELRYSPSLDGVYFRLTVPALGRTIALSQLAKLELVNLPWTYEELEYPGLDLAVLAWNQRDDIWQMAAVVKGSRVAVFRYGGREDLGEHLDVLAQAVQ